ncbi:MAG: HDOD domain-containing protein [Desulfosalsimonadaceae bacterium]
MELPGDIQNRLDSLKKLPTLPVVIENLSRALNDPEVEADRVAGIIGDDPAIMARIMKVVNSAYYKGAQTPASLRAAIVRLGFRTVSNIALSAAVFSTFPPQAGTVFDRREFWRHCICTGIAAECLCSELPRFGGLYADPEDLHLYGLLHDIGKIIFEQYFHGRFVEALELSRSRQVSLSAAEERVLGADHACAGAWLGKRWRLSAPVLAVIRWHHSPHNAPAEYRELVMLTYLANLVTNAAGLGDSGNAYPRYAQKITHEFDLEEKDLLYLINYIEKGAENSPLLEALAE